MNLTNTNSLNVIKTDLRNILTLTIFLFTLNGFSCTTFVLKDGKEMVFGRNLDWHSDNGIVVINQRNQYKKSIVFPPDSPIEWESKYGSITFNQFGKEFPFGGMNEVGLVIEIMVAPAEYPKTDQRGAVNELQWIQYQLDNASTVEEVIANNTDLRIRKISQQLHFLVADAKGNTAVIEFKNGEMIAYKDDSLPYPVLENDTYNESLSKYKNGFNCRFTRVVNKISNYTTQPNSSLVDYSFSILNDVAIDGSWSIVYDLKNFTIDFKTASNQNIKRINGNEINFECSKNTLIYDLAFESSGVINTHFVPLTDEINRLKLEDALVKGNVNLPIPIKAHFLNYHNTVYCHQN